MRHLILLCAILLIAYVAWHLAGPQARQAFVSLLKRHLWRFGLLVLIVGGLFVWAFSTSSLRLL